MDDLKRQVSVEQLVALARGEGLPAVGRRIGCPARCSEDPRACSVGPDAGVVVYHCQRCKAASGSALDLLVATRGVDLPAAADALREWLGTPAATPPKRSRRPAARDAAALWAALPAMDPAGFAYLKARKLERAVELGLLRFSVGRSGDRWLDAQAELGLRVAVAIRSPANAIASLQLRQVMAGATPTKLTLARAPFAHLGGGFICLDVAAARAAPVVVVAEGIADAAAVLCSETTAPVLGVPGQDQLAHVTAALGDLRGRLVVLLPQNDPPAVAKGGRPAPPTSQELFARLKLALEGAGASALVLATPAEHEDAAAWRAADGGVGLTTALRASVGQRPPAAPTTAPVAVTPAKLRVVEGGVAVDQSPTPAPAMALQPLRNSYASLCQIMRVPALRAKVMGEGDLEFNERTLLPEVGRRALAPRDMSEIRERAEREFVDSKMRAIEFARADIEQAVVSVAQEHPYHPVADWLRSLKWDGVERVSHLAADVLEIDPTPPLTAAILRKWMLSATARALLPGCKVDTVLVFIGRQGKRKSSFFPTLVGEEWFSDSPMNVENKDAMLLLHRAWVHEWAELEAVVRARDQGSVKAFVSRKIDDFRPPYQAQTLSFPRRSVIVGTTNERDFLSDPAGARRYWPIDTPEVLNLDALAEMREQLWAETVCTFNAAAGCAACQASPLERCPAHRWHMDEAQERELRVLHGDYEPDDPWGTDIASWLAKPANAMSRVLTTALVMEEALRLPTKDRGRPEQMRVAALLRRFGFDRARRMVDGAKVYEWVRQPKAGDQEVLLK